jgi:hypothetical protein
MRTANQSNHYWLAAVTGLDCGRYTTSGGGIFLHSAKPGEVQFVASSGYHRKYALYLLNHQPKIPHPHKKR